MPAMEMAHSGANFVRSLSTIWWICFPIAVFDGYDTLMMSFLAPVISRELGLAPTMFRGVFTATYAGAACGAILLGRSADRFGRKTVLLWALALAGVFTAATAWVHTLQALMWCRALAGVGLGGAIPIISALAAGEVLLEHRRAAVTRVFIGYPVGAIVGGLLTAWLTGSVGWRNLMLATGGITLALLALTARCLNEPNSAPTSSVSDRSPMGGLFGPNMTYVTITLSTTAFLILGVSYFLVSWIPTVLTLEGLSVPAAAVISVLLNVGGLIGAWALSRVGRRAPARPIGGCLCLGALLIAAFGFALHGNAYIVAAIVLCMGFLVIGAQTNIPALAAWIYPLPSSASGVGLSMACGRIGSIAGPLIGGYLLASHMSWSTLFQIAAVPTLLAGVALFMVSVAGRRHP